MSFGESIMGLFGFNSDKLIASEEECTDLLASREEAPKEHTEACLRSPSRSSAQTALQIPVPAYTAV